MSGEAEKGMISSGHDVLLGDHSPAPQQQEITVDHHPHMSMDELLKVIKGANGMPVLFVPSKDGRLAAVAVDGLRNLVPTNHEVNASNEKKSDDFRDWLLLIMSLVATVTFTAGLAPPCGFWSTDDKANGYIAGTPVMSNKSPRRYLLFHYSNTTAFFTSLMIIGALTKNKEITVVNNRNFGVLVGLCFLSLGTSYIAGTSVSLSRSIYAIAVFIAVSTYIWLHWFLISFFRISRAIPARGQLITTNG